MTIEFRRVSSFNRGLLLKLLKDAYSFDYRYEQNVFLIGKILKIFSLIT